MGAIDKAKQFVKDALKGPGSRLPKPRRSMLGSAMKSAKEKQKKKLDKEMIKAKEVAKIKVKK